VTGQARSEQSPVVRVAFSVALLAAALLIMAGGTIAAGSPPCLATVYVDGQPFESPDDLLEELQRVYTRSAQEDGTSRPAYSAIAQLTSTGRLSSTGAPAADTERMYVGETEHGQGELRMVRTDAGWMVDAITVPVPSATCEEIAKRSAAVSGE
jgi:hypothetical protein